MKKKAYQATIIVPLTAWLSVGPEELAIPEEEMQGLDEDKIRERIEERFWELSDEHGLISSLSGGKRYFKDVNGSSKEIWINGQYSGFGSLEVGEEPITDEMMFGGIEIILPEKE